MADRSVMVRLLANVQGFTAGMAQAQAATNQLGTKFKAESEIVGRGLTGIGVAAGAAVALAVAKFAEFDQAMSFVQAATHESASGMGLLRDAAIEAGASTVFSATESANAIEELSKAGVSTADILGGALAGALDLAAAGGLGVARAAEISSTALTQFKLTGGDAGHVADVLAAGAGKAMGSVEDLAAGLKFVGPVAQSMGISLEETTGTLALFAQQGIIGEQAGTSLRGVLSSLTSPSIQARNEIDRLGITLYDQQGNFLGLKNAAGQLSNAYTDMDGASRDASLGIIFGRETVTAATALYQAGADGVAEWTKAVDDSGYAADTAAMRLDNLSGDLEKLGGAFDTALIKTGSAANDSLRVMTQVLTALVDTYSDMPQPVQNSALAFGVLTAAVGLTGGAFLLGVPKIVEYRLALATLSSAAQGVGTALSTLGKATLVIGVLTTAASALITWAEAAEKGAGSAEELKASILDTASAYSIFQKTMTNRGANIVNDVGPFVSSMERFRDLLQEVSGYSDDLWGDIGMTFNVDYSEMKDFLEGWEKLGSSLADVAGSGDMESVSSALSKIQKEAGLTSDELYELIERSPELSAALAAQAEAAGISADKQGILKIALSGVKKESTSAADAYLKAADKASALDDQVNKLIDSFMKANNVGQDAVSANIDYLDALADVDEYIRKAQEGQEGYALTLDQSTQAGRDNTQMLNDLAAQSQDAAAKQFALDGNTANYKATLEAGRQSLYDRALQLTGNAEAAQALTDKIYAIPAEKAFKMIADLEAAQAEINAFIARNNERVVKIMVRSDANQGNVTDIMGGYALGGYTGSGGKYEPRGIVHADEFVSTKETLADPANRAALEYMHAGGSMASFAGASAVGGYAGARSEGGFVSASMYTTPTIAMTQQASDRPIMMDGKLFGVMRQMANGEAQIVVHDALSAESDRSRAGSRRI